MNFLDIIILIPLALFSYKGLKNGLIMEVFFFVSIIAGVYMSIRFSAWVGSTLGLNGDTAALTAFVITFLAVLIATYLIGKLLETIVKKLSLGWINKMGGLCLGLLKTVLLVGLLIFFWNKIDPKQHILTPEIRGKSMLFKPVEKTVYKVWPILDSLNKQIKDI